MEPEIPRALVPSIDPDPGSPRRIAADFARALDEGARILAAGSVRKNPARLLDEGYRPKHRLVLFDRLFYVTGPRQNEDIRFFVGYVGRRDARGRAQRFHARIWYKDISLTWRSASHYIRSDIENWLGKGELKPFVANGETLWGTDESTTDLPLEMQTALETLSRAKRIPYDDEAVELVLRRGPDDRTEAYRDFIEPRRKAASNPRNLVNGGRRIARFTRRNDPTSLRFAKGYAPDFDGGVLERSHSMSGLYGGKLRRFRIASENRLAQYFFFAGPKQVWISSCQATTTQLSSFGVRTIDAEVDDDLLLPAYEYHYLEDATGEPFFHSQIPEGFVGAPSPRDPYRSDASPWLDRMPVIREFRRKILGARKSR